MRSDVGGFERSIASIRLEDRVADPHFEIERGAKSIRVFKASMAGLLESHSDLGLAVGSSWGMASFRQTDIPSVH